MGGIKKAWNETVEGFGGLFDFIGSDKAADIATSTVTGGVAGGVGSALGLGDENVPTGSTTTATIGGQLGSPGKTFSEEEEANKLKGISKKRTGTRGLQIPLTADETTTDTAAGIQI